MKNKLVFTDEEKNLYASEGWGIFCNGKDFDFTIERYDIPEDWKEQFPAVNIPLLESDNEAYKLASKYFVLNENVIVGRK